MRAFLARELSGFVRRPAFFRLRALVFLIPFLILCLAAGSADEGPGSRPDGSSLFWTTSFTILLVVILLAPALVAPVLVEEKRNGKLEVLLSVPASRSTIVLAKGSCRLAILLLMLLPALLIPAIALTLGGIDPVHWSQLIAVTAVTAAWTTAVALRCSAGARDAAHALRAAYALVIAVVFGGALIYLLLWMSTFGRGPPSPGSQEWLWLVTTVNPLLLWSKILGPGPVPALPVLGMDVDPLAFHAAFWLGLSALLLHGSARRFGRDSVARGSSGSEPGPRAGPAAPARPPSPAQRLPRRRGYFSRRAWLLAADPMLWLESLGSSGARPGLRRQLAAWIPFLALEGWFLLSLEDDGSGGYFNIRQREAHGAAANVALLLAFAVAARHGSLAHRREAEAGAAEVLRGTPVPNAVLVRSKLAGTLWAAGPWWLLSCLHVLLGCASRGFEPYALLPYAIVSVILIFALAVFALGRGAAARSATGALVVTFASAFAWLVLFPLGAAFLFASTSSAKTIMALVSMHPSYIATWSFLLGTDTPGDFMITPVLWITLYLGFGIVGLNGLRVRQDEIRSDETGISIPEPTSAPTQSPEGSPS